MTNSIRSLLNTPHFTEEIQNFVLDGLEKKDTFKETIPIDQFLEFFGIERGSKTLKVYSKHHTRSLFLEIFEKNIKIGLLKNRILNHIFSNLDIYNLYLYKAMNHTTPIYREISDNLNFFNGEKLHTNLSNLSETESFKLCNAEYQPSKDLIFLLFFCMSIDSLEKVLKENLSYSFFIKKLIDIKKVEKDRVFSI